MANLSKQFIEKEGKIHYEEWKKLYKKCVSEGGEEDFCSLWAEKQMELLGWYTDDNGKERNEFIEIDKKDKLDINLNRKLKLDLEDILDKRKRNDGKMLNKSQRSA